MSPTGASGPQRRIGPLHLLPPRFASSEPHKFAIRACRVLPSLASLADGSLRCRHSPSTLIRDLKAAFTPVLRLERQLHPGHLTGTSRYPPLVEHNIRNLTTTPTKTRNVGLRDFIDAMWSSVRCVLGLLYIISFSALSSSFPI